MVRIERVRSNDGSGHAVMDLQVSTAAELPSLGDKICNLIVDAGTIAQIIQDNSWLTIDADGTWYPES